jgi:hypothetical protein
MLRVIIALALLTSLAACGTRLNPFNWFTDARQERIRVEDSTPSEARDGRALVAEVVDLAIDPTPQGAILRAMGRAQTQGYWEAELVEVERTAGTLVYEFRVFPPLGATPQGSAQSREVITGLALSHGALRGIRSITVIGAETRASITRR